MKLNHLFWMGLLGLALITPSLKAEEQENATKGLSKGNVLLSTARDIPGVNYEHLKPLEWLVGEWRDRDDDVDISFHTIWDKHKNYLIRKFVMRIPDEENLTGVQLITWDPITKKIRSWVFDSDGGFGEGFWLQDENTWVVKVAYTLSDGRLSSSTQIYTKIDNDTYTYTSISRDVDGEVLPNIETVKIVRQK